MAIPKLKKEYVIDALKYIDKNGVPDHNQSTKYELVTDDGKRYPPKYVVAVADHLANGTDIVTVSKQLGHASITTTENFYSHIIEENKAKAAECIADVLIRKKA